MAADNIQECIDTAVASGHWMMALWWVEGGTMKQFRTTRSFPRKLLGVAAQKFKQEMFLEKERRISPVEVNGATDNG